MKIAVLPGDTVYFNRTSTPAAPPGPGPEGTSGQAYSVPPTVPSATRFEATGSMGASKTFLSATDSAVTP